MSFKYIYFVLLFTHTLNLTITKELNTKEALYYTQELANESTLVIVNIDMPNIAHLLAKDYKQEIKRAQELCGQQKKEGYQAIAMIRTIMKMIQPIFPAAYKLAPNVIGVTRRKLRWAHLVHRTCKEQEMDLSSKRLAVIVTKQSENDEEKPRILECNAHVLYIDDVAMADAIEGYIAMWMPECSRIVFLDTDIQTVKHVTNELQAHDHNRPVIGLIAMR